MTTKKKNNRFFSIDVFGTKFKYSLLTIMLIYLVGLVQYVVMHFRTDDPIPQVTTIDAIMRRQFRYFSAKVRAGLYIKNFSVFDFEKNDFMIDGMVWFEFNKNEVMLKTIEKFSFENSKIVYKSPPNVKINDDRILVTYDVIFSVKTDVSFYRFPLEDHRLSIVLTNDFVSPSEMYFDDEVDSLSFTISDRLFTSNWQVHSLNILSGYSALHYDVHRKERKINTPKVVFTINFRKFGLKKIMVIFVPIFAAIFFSLFSFLSHYANLYARYGLTVTPITALLGYRFVIENISPSVGYFTVSDKLYVFFILFAFLTFVFQLWFSRRFAEKGSTAQETAAIGVYAEKISSIAYFISLIIFVVAVTYIILA